MTTNIYILKLTDGKWYVGKTDDVLGRYQQHLRGYGSYWTKKYKPISLEKTIENVSHFEEDKVTKEYMAKYGIENVRGGSYCNIELDELQTDTLNREIWGAQNKCARCGRSGHFQKDCYAKTDISGNKLEVEVWCCETCEDEFDDYDACAKHEKYCGKSIVTCFRCGREGHYSTTCYAKFHMKGYYIR
jgi:predicted GIY-YIG superfamily endonuclease